MFLRVEVGSCPTYAFDNGLQALDDLGAGKVQGRAILVPDLTPR